MLDGAPRRESRPVRCYARAHLRKPIVGAQTFPGFVLLPGEQGASIPILAALEPAERAFGFVQQNWAARAVDLALAAASHLMLRAERIAFGSAPAQPRPADMGEAKPLAVPLEPILREAGFDQLGGDRLCGSGGCGGRALGEEEASRAIRFQLAPPPVSTERADLAIALAEATFAVSLALFIAGTRAASQARRPGTRPRARDARCGRRGRDRRAGPRPRRTHARLSCGRAEQRADRGETEAADHMGEIHRHLTGECGLWR